MRWVDADKPTGLVMETPSFPSAQDRSRDKTENRRTPTVGDGEKQAPRVSQESTVPAPPSDSDPTGSLSPLPAGMRFFGEYELLGEIARGGMGIIYKARHRTLGRVVALKTIKNDILRRDEEFRRFAREMKAVAKLRHANIVPIYDVGCHEGRPYFTMPFLAEGSLSSHRQRLRREPGKAVAIMEKVARAIHHAHEQQILHRDLKPSNVLMDKGDEPIVSDFGLAKLTSSELEETTQSGTVLGTPSYMAPEQARGRLREVGRGTDIWALGVMLYELLSGQRPFVGESNDEVRYKIVEESPPTPRTVRPEIPRALERIILKCLEKQPEQRYASAEALADDLAIYLKESTSPEKTHRGWLRLIGEVGGRARWGIAAGLLVLVAVFALVFKLQSPATPTTVSPPPPPATLVLLKELGPPREGRWVFGKPGARIKNGDVDEPFALSANTSAILELMAEPPWLTYRFEAEIRQETGQQLLSGIYIGHTLEGSENGLLHFLIPIWFADQGELFGRCECSLARYGDPGDDQELQAHAFGSLDSFQPALLAKGKEMPWRQLAFEVTPQEIRAFLNNKLIATVTERDFQGSLGILQKASNSSVPKIAFPPRGGIGLYLRGGEASFRNAILTPR
jgi:serine/threonine-protein kinase